LALEELAHQQQESIVALTVAKEMIQLHLELLQLVVAVVVDET
jgi:hypothetical protein